MNNLQQRRLDKFERIITFMSVNAVDFPENSPGDKTAKGLAAVVAEIKTLNANQVSGFDSKAQASGNKEEARENLLENLEKINLAAKAMADEVNGIEDKFRLPRKTNQATLLATARSFAADAAPLAAKFVEYGLEADFLEDLNSHIKAFEGEGTAADSSQTAHAEATGALADAFRRGMTLTRKLESIVKIRYHNSTGKLAAFVVASHLERQR